MEILITLAIQGAALLFAFVFLYFLFTGNLFKKEALTTIAWIVGTAALVILH